MQTVQIDLQSNRVTITPNPEREFPLTSIPERIRGAGFEPDDMTIIAHGTISEKDGSTRFRIKNWTTTYPIELRTNPKEQSRTLQATVQFQSTPPVLKEKK